jgi:Cd2+/Zn2+-exporting ATPase
MGAAGTDVALETADLVLMGDRLELIPYAIGLSKKARRVVWQNISFSIGVIILLIGASFAAGLALPLGVLGHEGSTVIVVLNGLISLLLWPEVKRRRAGKT